MLRTAVVAALVAAVAASGTPYIFPHYMQVGAGEEVPRAAAARADSGGVCMCVPPRPRAV